MSRFKGIRQASVEPNEIVIGPRSLWVDLPMAVSREAALAGVQVAGAAGSVRVTNRGHRVTWVPSAPLMPGSYELTIGELVTRTGRRVTEGATIPFKVVVSRARVPKTLVIEHMVRLEIAGDTPRRVSLHTLPRGQVLELIKGHRRGTMKPEAMAFTGGGRRTDADRVLQTLGNRRLRRARKVHPHLAAKLKKARRSARVPVAVWLRHEDPLMPRDELRLRNRRRRGTPRDVARRREAMMAGCEPLAVLLRARGATRVTIDTLAPVVYANVRPDLVDWLRGRREVLSVFHAERRGIDDLQDSIEIANTDHVHNAGERGDGTRVAVWERGPDVTTNLDIEAQFSAAGATSAHSRLTHGIIKNTQAKAPHGHAPECLLFSANSYDRDALRWAVDDADCTVISQSFHRDEEQTDGDLSYDDIYKDWLALRWPYPTIVQAAGNDANPGVEYVNHKGYNSLAVGNHDDSAQAMSATSVYRNPTGPHGDRELPEISANGTSVTAVGRTSSGTSFAAPAVAGIAALLQSTNTILRHWPEGNRAILLAGATRNVKEQTWWEDVRDGVDAADGTGAVNALESYRIAQSRRSRNNPASRRGWDVGLLDGSDFNADRYSTFSYWLKVPETRYPRFFWGPRHVKVALAWTSEVRTLDELVWFLPAVPFSSALTVDLDVRVYDAKGNLVASSLSWDNSYEIAEFDGVPGETYRIRIHRWSGTDPTWFGIAWTVTGGLVLQQAIPVAALRRAIRLLD